MAAGLTLKSENLIAFKKAIEEAIISQIQGQIPKPTVSYHMAIILNDLSPTMYKEFERIGPFGPCNEVPVFMAAEVNTAIKISSHIMDTILQYSTDLNIF